jgi:hypothetical protein
LRGFRKDYRDLIAWFAAKSRRTDGMQKGCGPAAPFRKFCEGLLGLATGGAGAVALIMLAFKLKARREGHRQVSSCNLGKGIAEEKIAAFTQPMRANVLNGDAFLTGLRPLCDRLGESR